MKNIFNFNRKKKAEERSASTIEYPIFSDALQFGNIVGNYTAMNISAVYRAVEIISDSIAMLPINIMQNKENVYGHSLNFVFKAGLSNMTKYNFMKLMVQSILLRGNAFAYVERGDDGHVIGLRYLDDVQIHHIKKNNTIYYTSATIGSKKIEACNMIHLFKNTYDGIQGVSVLSYARRSINLANNTENSASHFFDNGCNLSGVLTVAGQLSAQQKQDIRSSWNQAYSAGGQGLAIIQGNMQYQPIQLSAADSQMLESRQFNVSDIARFFGISPVLLGDLSHSSYSTIEATQNQFLLHTLQPYIILIEEEFNRKLVLPSEDIQVNLDETYLLRTDKSAQASYFSTLLNSGVLSINEVRTKLGYNEIEGGDKHLIAYTKVSDNTIENNEDKNNLTDEKNL